MEIVRRQQEGYLEVVFEGRLDGYWAEHLSTAVGEAMHEGKHAVRVNLAKASYISSAGIGVLVQLYHQFTAVNGTFAITEPSAAVKKVLDLVGVGSFLTGAATVAQAAAPKSGPAAAAVAPEPAVERREIGGTAFEIHRLKDSAELVCRVVGDPSGLGKASFTASHCRSISVTENRFALGLGAFGDDFEQSRDRFGEFLAVSGAAACQPTDGTNVPDYMTSSGSFVPKVSTLYGVYCEGAYSKLVRFESAAGSPATFSSVIDACLESAGTKTAGFVMVAESAGLMGAALKKPPVSGGGLFQFPEIRKWLNFSPERCHTRALIVIVGVATVDPPMALEPLVRPLAKRTKTAGHFHAAAFGYRPLQKGKLDLRNTIRGVFDAGGLQGVLHLLADDREIAGGGESELLRGACWVGPVRGAERD
jgi:anti-anti-sigma factor